MSGPFHRATASHWQQVEQVASSGTADCNVILELRARVEALEAAQEQPPAPAPAGSLVEVVQAIINAEYEKSLGTGCNEARAAIRAVSDWLADLKQRRLSYLENLIHADRSKYRETPLSVLNERDYLVRWLRSHSAPLYPPNHAPTPFADAIRRLEA